MDFIEEAFGRMNLHQLRSFLLYGTDDYGDRTAHYGDTLNASSRPIYRRLEKIYDDEPTLDKAMAELSDALTAYEHIYMELGMKAGARLLYELLFTDGPERSDMRDSQPEKDAPAP